MNPWVAIVGRGQSGRREAVQGAIDALRARGVRVEGFLHVPLPGSEHEKTGYDIVSLASGEHLRLASIVSKEPDVCDYGFEQGVFEQARRWVEDSDAPVVVVEVGIVEARGGGHWPGIQDALEGPPRVVFMAIRPKALVGVALRLPDPEAALECPFASDDAEAFVDAVAELAAAQ